MNSLTTQSSPLLNDRAYQQYVEQGIAALRKAGHPDSTIRQEFLLDSAHAGLSEGDANKFIPAPPPPTATLQQINDTGPMGPLGAPAGIGELMHTLGIQGPDILKNLGGMLASGARGVTLGATDYIPPLKNVAASYRKDHPGAALATEVGVGTALNPFSALRAAKNLPVVGDALAGVGNLLAPATASVGEAGIKGFLKAAGRGAVQAAPTAAVYGFNTADDTSPKGRSLAGLIGGVAALPIGGLAGGMFHGVASRAAAKTGPIGGTPTPTSEMIRDAFKAEGGLPDPASLKPGQTLLDVGGPAVESLFGEAVRGSDKALVQGNRWKADRIKQLGQNITDMAADAVGMGATGKQFPNMEILHRELLATAKRNGGPLYEAIQRANPVPPPSPELDAVLGSAVARRLMSGNGAANFAQDAAAADALRALRAAQERGIPIVANPNIVQRQGIEKVFDFNTLNLFKKRLDDEIGAALKNPKIGNVGNLMEIRDGLLTALDNTIPEFAAARAAYAEPTVAAEMVQRGMEAGTKSGDAVEALLTDPATLRLGQNAVEHAKIGALGALVHQFRNLTPDDFASGAPWTPDRLKILSLVATNPEQAALLPEVVQHTGQQFAKTALVPATKMGIQTRPGERLRGVLAAMGASMGVGEPGLAIRHGTHFLRATEGGMTGQESADLAELLTSRDAPDILRALLRQPPVRPSSVGPLAGRITNAVNPL